MNPKVTIGICARNSQDSIGFAIKSVVEQDFPHELMEIIFIDDGSEDHTLRIVKDCVSRMDIHTKIFSGKWRGLGKARNTVLNEALGDYVVWVDSDEILTSDFVSTQIRIIEQNSNAGIVTARMGILPDENPILSLDLIPSVVEHSIREWTNPTKLPGTGGATYRLSAARQAGGFDEGIKGTGEDIDLANRIRQSGWLILRGNAMFYERHGNMSTWKDLWKRHFNNGVHCRRLYQKNNMFFSLYKINPFASFLAGVIFGVSGYRVTKKKISLMVPFHFTFKNLAWFYGFTKG